MIIEVYEPMKREEPKEVSKTKNALYGYLGSYKLLACFFVASLATIWAECGYPSLSYKDGGLFMCAYEMPAHEIIIKLIGA